MEDEEESPWNKQPDLRAAITAAELASTEDVGDVTVQITLSGLAARQYHFVSQILRAGFTQNSSEVDAHLLHCGVVEQIRMMANLAASEMQDQEIDNVSGG